jgi:hypothetical protein
MPQKQTPESNTNKRTLGYIKDGVYVKSTMVDKAVKYHNERASYRQSQREDMAFTYAREIVQPNDPNYYEAFPNRFKGESDV